MRRHRRNPELLVVRNPGFGAEQNRRDRYYEKVLRELQDKRAQKSRNPGGRAMARKRKKARKSSRRASKAQAAYRRLVKKHGVKAAARIWNRRRKGGKRAKRTFRKARKARRNYKRRGRRRGRR